LAWRFSGLFCTGGETARALLTAAGAVGIRLVGEVEAGVPLGTMEGWHNLPIVTKAGAFGTPQTLVHCRAALRRLLAQQT
jgi:D-threonate/D-erythronate kinase